MVVGPDGALPLPWLGDALTDALARSRAHAVLVHGAPGVGTLPFMLTLAQGWLCERQPPEGPRPCGQCGSCRLVQSRLHPDLLVLLPEVQRQALGWPLSGDKPDEGGGEGGSAKRKPSKQIRIDEVRLAIDWVVKTSSRGRGKVLVLHPAEALNVHAGNSLLKTLEEPPPGTRLVLGAADPEHLLPTVRSRCQRLSLPAPSTSESLRWLAEQSVDDPAVLLAAAAGRPLDALQMAQSGVDARAWAALPRALAGGQGAGLAGWPVPRLVDALQKLCHDAMARAAGGAERYFPPGSVTAGASIGALSGWGASLARVARHDEHAWNEGLLLDALLSEGRRALAPTSRTALSGPATSAGAGSRPFDKLRP